MPYMIKKDGDKWCVHKENEDKTPGDVVKCHPTEKEAKDHLAALYANVEEAKGLTRLWAVLHGPNTMAVKAVSSGETWELDVLGVPFGSQDKKDFDGQWFTNKTDIMMNVGDKRPVLYYHGMAPNGERVNKPEVIGVSEYTRTDDQGHWFRIVLDQTKKLAKRIWNAARRGLTYASSGALAHLFRGNDKGEIKVWPVGEISIIDVGHGRAPANWDAVALPMKAVFNDAGLEMPESFEEGDEPESNEVAEELTPEQIIAEEIEMPQKVIAIKTAADLAFTLAITRKG